MRLQNSWADTKTGTSPRFKPWIIMGFSRYALGDNASCSARLRNVVHASDVRAWRQAVQKLLHRVRNVALHSLQVLRQAQIVFLDKLCIAQHDAALKDISPIREVVADMFFLVVIVLQTLYYSWW